MAIERFAKEALGRGLIAAPLQKNVQYDTILVDGPPEVILPPIDGHKYLIAKPGITEPAFTTLE